MTVTSNQHSPYAIQIELTEGCNLYCNFCGLQGIREKENRLNLKWMRTTTAHSIAEQIRGLQWPSRIEFAMHGEPTLHPEYHKVIEIFRSHLPKHQIMMTSNGVGFLKGKGQLEKIIRTNIFRLFHGSGVNILALDDYKNVGIVGEIRNAIADYPPLDDVIRYEYPSESAGSPHRRVKCRERSISFVQDISVASKGNHSHINNHAGAGAPPNKRQEGKRCAKPFRELSVRWDGNIAVCCNDWRGIYKCGNVVSDGLETIWQGSEFDAARRRLYLGLRDFGPCDGCDARSYRVGLLPDPRGQESMPTPDEKSDKWIEHAVSGPPYTRPVFRPWEEEK